jgi:aspartate-semialdehyde dehydrogenase
MRELEQQARDWTAGSPLQTDIFKRQYLWNLFSHNSDIDADTGYNTEETKMVKETRKIFHEPKIRVSVTCVRVPVLRAHCESINLTFSRPISPDRVREILAAAPGVKVVDDPANNKFPEPLDASGRDEVLVGRIRQDVGQDDGVGIEMFIAGDQLRKGAALNAVQIAELLQAKVPA